MIVNDHLEEAAKRGKERTQWLLDIEGNPTTHNTRYFSSCKDKFLTYYRGARSDNGLAERLLLDRGKERTSEYEASLR